MNAKYTNATSLYRTCQEFERNDIMIPRQTLVNWVIRSAGRYLSLVYDEMRKELYKGHIIQAGETAVKVSKDGRSAGSESYMWLYRKANTTIVRLSYCISTRRRGAQSTRSSF